jgi:DNA-binding NarL/FixJ family response regulator
MPRKIIGCCYLGVEKNGKIRILIADDHDVVRKGPAALVRTEPEIEVIAEAAGGNEALKLFSKFLPDLLLLDLRMPDKNGIQTMVEIRDKFPEARILVLSAFDGDEDSYRAFRAGGRGYLLKNTTRDELLSALRTVASGQNWVPKDVAVQLVSRKIRKQLTTREVEVLNELSKGLTNKEIANIMNISEHTVKVHLKNILRKLDAADRTRAVTTAIQRGIIRLQFFPEIAKK